MTEFSPKDEFEQNGEASYSLDVLAALRQEANAPLTVNYVNSLAGRYASTYLGTSLLHLSKNIEALDVDEDMNSSNRHGTAFLLGGLLGLRVVDAVNGQDIFDKMLDIDLGVEPDSVVISKEAKRQKSETLMSLGAVGCTLTSNHPSVTSAFPGLVEKLQAKIGPETDLQTYLQCGYGLMIYMADKVVTNELPKTEPDYAAEVDGFLKQLFGD